MEKVDSYSEEQIESTYSKRLDYLRETSRPKSGIIIKKSRANRDVGYSTLLSQVKKECVLSVVSGQESPKEAFQIVSEKFPRLDISLTWVQNFYSEMKFTQEKKMTDVGMQLKAIRELLEENSLLSQRALLKKLQDKGITISKGTLCKRLKELQNCN